MSVLDLFSLFFRRPQKRAIPLEILEEWSRPPIDQRAKKARAKLVYTPRKPFTVQDIIRFKAAQFKRETRANKHHVNYLDAELRNPIAARSNEWKRAQNQL